jgi:hypothetical protein
MFLENNLFTSVLLIILIAFFLAVGFYSLLSKRSIERMKNKSKDEPIMSEKESYFYNRYITSARFILLGIILLVLFLMIFTDFL